MAILTPLGRRRRGCLVLSTVFFVLLVAAVVGSFVFFPNVLTFLPWHPGKHPLAITPTVAPQGHIGLSDGAYAIDINPDRKDASLKIQAAAKFAKGDKAGAISLWSQAVGNIGNDTSDAEPLIYLEDQRIIASGLPYMTLVVGTVLTGDPDAITTGRDSLQGAYVAQKGYNNSLKPGGKLLRLLIANADKIDHATAVAQQIVQAAKADSTIVGVMGWPYSTYTQKIIPILAQAHIPMVSQTASADDLSGISPYFFRVAPPNSSQAIAGARYAEQQLHSRRLALFFDPTDDYTSTLANDFKKQFVDVDRNLLVDTEQYTVGDKAGLPTLVQKALKNNPDLIYFGGYVDDVAVLLNNVPTSLPNLQVLGGDGLYGVGGYPTGAQSSRLHFTAFAYPDEWSILGMNTPQPFFSEYIADFNPIGADHSAQPYGFTRADGDVILSYDAMLALLQGCQNALTIQDVLTSDALQKGLTQITGAKVIQGVSGQISFGSNGDPLDKAVVVLYVDQQGRIHLLEPNGVLGCFAVGKCG